MNVQPNVFVERRAESILDRLRALDCFASSKHPSGNRRGRCMVVSALFGTVAMVAAGHAIADGDGIGLTSYGTLRHNPAMLSEFSGPAAYRTVNIEARLAESDGRPAQTETIIVYALAEHLGGRSKVVARLQVGEQKRVSLRPNIQFLEFQTSSFNRRLVLPHRPFIDVRVDVKVKPLQIKLQEGMPDTEIVELQPHIATSE